MSRPARRQYEPTTFIKRWSRQRRRETLKGVPAFVRHEFVYSFRDLSEIRNITRDLINKINLTFPIGDVTVALKKDDVNRVSTYVVTQTREQIKASEGRVRSLGRLIRHD